ncbi:hypothetical protein CP97_07955 [Aurantiacibacter atlanticus]|uniref:Uncharacterized protein n=1 Tax=Aurantiacibacter atlanticus TaxID=1648404 RepID=A0A0H4VJV8_9SPHN|nr:tetratricopeptide repeat protein [Aurantiacibacter atlanticus]AKQ43284.2 hypothetical protein CP97_07955 [Aurantiacibacter atlanticus]
MNSSPEHYRQRAKILADTGDVTGALGVLREGISAFPNDAPLANSTGNMAMRSGDAALAEACFAQALRIDGHTLEYAINLAIALARLERHDEAVEVLSSLETQGANDARYCSVRATSHRSSGDLRQARIWYDHGLALEPTRPNALHGRARIALESGEADAVQLFERALVANQTDAEAWLGLAEALDAAGEPVRAQELAQKLVAQAPHWIAALRVLAQLRLAAGDDDFASHFADAARQRPQDIAIVQAHAAILSGHDHPSQAAEVIAAARLRIPNDQQLALLEAMQRGMAGQDDAAQEIFASLNLDTPDRAVHEARHRIRRGEMGRAEILLERALAVMPDSTDGWALRDFLWRMRGDDRAAWLHGQVGLVHLLPLPGWEVLQPDLLPLLHQLHDGAAFPLTQSLRGGTQTRGTLLDRAEPEITHLHEALLDALADYRAGLPAKDKNHPLLRHRDAPWSIAGSWSVRLAGGGDRHAAHVHPEGIVSSALYCDLPKDIANHEGQAGWIELGRPPDHMRLDLGPLHVLQPKDGYLALFPSTLYHGTVPFTSGRRMTVAFDVQCQKGAT